MAGAEFVYGLFGFSLNEIFSMVRFVIGLVIVLYTASIPFKKTYHWAFLLFGLAVSYYSFVPLYAGLAPDAATYAARLIWVYLSSNRLLALLIFQFVVYFVAPKPTRRMKLALIAGYAYVAATNWVPFFVDPSFLLTRGAETATGFISGPGTSDAYLRPAGVDIYVSVVALASLYLLLRYYRTEKSPLVRGQVRYLVVGTIVVAISTYLLQFARITGGINYSYLVFGAGLIVLLLGLRKHGFYAVRPTLETAPLSETRKYALEDRRSYLFRDASVAFDAFSELVKSGRSGLCITRTFPENVRKSYGLQTTPMLWLAEEKRGDAIPPTDLLGLSLSIKDFINRADGPSVLLQGLEYLVRLNGFSPVLRLIDHLNEASAQKSGILLLVLTPNTLSPREEALIEAETTTQLTTGPTKGSHQT